MRDVNLFFRNTTDSLTATETSAWVAIMGTPAAGLPIFVEVPKQSVGDTLAITLQFSADGTNSIPGESLQLDQLASTTVAITDGVTMRKVIGGYRRKYARLILTVAGTSPDFGAVRAGVDQVGLDQNRLGMGALDSVVF